MPINWKQPEGKFIVGIQSFFHMVGWHEGAAPPTQNHEKRSKDRPPKYSDQFLYAHIREIIGELQPKFDQMNLPKGQTPHYVLTNAFYSEAAYRGEIFDPAIPYKLREDFFIADVEGEGDVVFCSDRILVV